jgi:DNA repair exonuclease SbcCD nuclease subunit
MKISILSDFHFGFAYNSELENDSFENAEEAVEKALDADLILIAGDIFDSRMPKTGVWAKAIKVLVKPLLRESSGVKLIQSSKELKEISKRTLRHLPVVALHGTHERRGKDEINAVEALDGAGLLIHLHCQTTVFEKNRVKVAVHGMSGVPERFAKDVLYKWNPKPVEGCFNVLMLHQSIDPFVYSPLEPPSLNLSNLPRGFDLIIGGHIHLAGQKKIENTALVFPGSTIVTQLEQNEAEAEKGFYQIDLDKEIKISFIPLTNNRKFFYEEIKLESGSVREQIEERINGILNKNLAKIPIIKLKIFGKEVEVLNQELRDIERKYVGQAAILFVKELEAPEIAKKIEFLRNLREQKLSVEEIGFQILKKNLEELNFDWLFDHEQAFGMLSENEVEKVFNILTGEQTILTQVLKKSLKEEKQSVLKLIREEYDNKS